MSGYTQRRIGQVFSYHAPNDGQIERMKNLRGMAHDLADFILLNTPSCSEQTIAIGRLREVVMFANAAIVIPQD